MTFKSIIENIVEREARAKLLEVVQNERMGFGAVEMMSKDNLFQNFTVYFKSFPNYYRVLGFISENGFVTICNWRNLSDSEWRRF